MPKVRKQIHKINLILRISVIYVNAGFFTGSLKNAHKILLFEGLCNFFKQNYKEAIVKLKILTSKTRFNPKITIVFSTNHCVAMLSSKSFTYIFA